MAATEVVLSVRIKSARNGAHGVASFIRYVEHNDRHPDEARDVDTLVRYVHHRDRTSPEGRMFDATGPAGDEQREIVVDHVARSIEALRRRPGPTSTTSQRTAYCMIISPADSAGIDLHRLTRVAMSQLERDSGANLPPWIAGEHRNTAHPHVHVVLAAKRETSQGEYRTVVITRARLYRMKAALHEELARQRGVRLRVRGTALRAGEAATRSPLHPFRQSPSDAHRHARVEPPRREEILAFSRNGSRRYVPYIQRHPSARVAVMAGRLARHYRRQAERLARERQRGLEHDREHRWTR